jgi:L-asparaginase II
MVTSVQSQSRETPLGDRAYPDNPVLVRIWRAGEVESQHRGAWVVCDTTGAVREGRGAWERSVYARSTSKCLQALPLLESGAAQRFGYTDAEVALALASHNAEARHTQGVAAILARLGLSVADLLCGVQPPADPDARFELRTRGERPSALHNNCSGKHAGFLALAKHLGAPTRTYIDSEHPVQRQARQAVLEVCGLEPRELGTAVDGCSAPTFRMPLRALATAFARVANPQELGPTRRAACERMLASVAAYPEMIAGNHQRICTDLARVTRGRLFPKIGGDAVYAIGLRGLGLGLAIKIDDGTTRGLHALIVELLRRSSYATAEEVAALSAWREERIRNWAGLDIGHVEIVG